MNPPPPDSSMPSPAPELSEDSFRELLVSGMVLALQYWQQATLKSKVDLAMESKLWTVNQDGSTLVTRTLDKYLQRSSLPRRPRIDEVLRTLHFVLRHCEAQTPLRSRLEDTTGRLVDAHHQRSLQC